MKITFVEQIERHNAWRAKNYCALCGAHEYEIVEQIAPVESNNWYVRCPQCGYEGPHSPFKDIALLRWQQMPEGD